MMGGDADEGGCTAGCCGEIEGGGCGHAHFHCGDYDSDEDELEEGEVHYIDGVAYVHR